MAVLTETAPSRAEIELAGNGPVRKAVIVIIPFSRPATMDNGIESILAHPFATMRLGLAEGLRSLNAIRLGRRSGGAAGL